MSSKIRIRTYDEDEGTVRVIEGVGIEVEAIAVTESWPKEVQLYLTVADPLTESTTVVRVVADPEKAREVIEALTEALRVVEASEQPRVFIDEASEGHALRTGLW